MLGLSPDLIRLADSSAYLAPTVPAGDPHEALLTYLQDADNLAGEGEAETLMRIVVGARALAEQVRAVELAAAQLARQRHVTVRELAGATGMSERAATDRYKRRPAEPNS